MKTNITNIFCIISNIGSNQEMYLDKIFSDKWFINKTNLNRLIYNTTKPKYNIEDKTNSRYNYFSEEEYNKIEYNDILEYRSYDTIPYDTVYYFTLVKDIQNKNNLICITSSYQYENYKRWIAMQNIREFKYNLFAILIHSCMKCRFTNKINSLYSENEDMELLEFSRRILQDNYEFNDAKTRLPELNDTMNCSNACYIDDDNKSEESIENNISELKRFILDKVTPNFV